MGPTSRRPNASRGAVFELFFELRTRRYVQKWGASQVLPGQRLGEKLLDKAMGNQCDVPWSLLKAGFLSL